MAILSVKIRKKDVAINESIYSVLGEIDFEISKGQFVSIIGPSGCGKTTILKIISGLERDYSGQIFLENERIVEPTLDIGMVFQDHRLLPWLTVKENVAFALPNSRNSISRVNEILDLVGLTSFGDALPNQLSGGMAQRVALGRAIVNVPKILLLDEAFASLDDITRSKMQIELKKIVEISQTTSLLVTHNIDEAIMLSDRVLVLSNKPTSILTQHSIDLKHPRSKTSDEFNYYRNLLFNEL